MKYALFFIFLFTTTFTTLFSADKPVLDISFESGVPKDKQQPNLAFQLSEQAFVKDGALILDGSKRTYLSCTPTATLIGKSDITITMELQLKHKEKGSFTGLITNGADCNKVKGFALVYVKPILYFYICDGTTRKIARSKAIQLDTNTPTKIAVSVQRNKGVIFAVNGKTCESNVKTLPGVDIPNTKEMLLGSWFRTHILNGNIKRARIYKRVFTTQELINMTN